jgi:hypothetical protein
LTKFSGGAAAKSTGSDASFGLQGLAGAAASGGIQLSTLPPQHLQVNLKLKFLKLPNKIIGNSTII